MRNYKKCKKLDGKYEDICGTGFKCVGYSGGEQSNYIKAVAEIICVRKIIKII